jgi:hypothetical protein
VEQANALLLENKRLGLSGEPLGSTRYGRLSFTVEALLQAEGVFLTAPRLAREC